MNVLFLDVDGVLNSYQSSKQLDDSMIYHLGRIVSKINLKIVLSSTWRLYSDSLVELEVRLAKDGISIFDTTVHLVPAKMSIPSVERHFEIQEWLDRHKVEKFAILDDDNKANIEGHFFKTDPNIGLTKEIADSIINYFLKMVE